MSRLAIALVIAGPVAGAGPSAQRLDYPPPIAALLEESCFDCHAGRDPEAGLDLRALPAAAEPHALARLVRARDRVRAQTMPPLDHGALAPEQRALLAGWIEGTVAARAPHLPPAPGRVTVRRLSRAQVGAALRDLFGVSSARIAELPADDLGYGFDNIGDALAFSTLHLEKFLALAEDVAAAVIDVEDPAQPTTRRFEAEALAEGRDGVQADGGFAAFHTQGSIECEVVLPRPGRYALRVRACGDQAGDEPPRLLLAVDGETVATFAVPEPRRRPARKETTLQLAGGPRRMGMRFANDHWQPDHPDPQQRDRNLRVDWLEVVGPLDALPPPSGSAWWLRADDPALPPAERAAALLAPLAERAWRRPLREDEPAALAGVVTAALQRGERFAAGLRAAVVAVLCAPSFLFRLETGALGEGGDEPLGGHELAARLSFFLWSSVPDEPLLAAARSGALLTGAGLAAEVQRLLRDPRASALATDFAAQWLELRAVHEAMPDPARFGAIGPRLLADMRRETELLFEAVLREGRDVRELLDADFTFLNAGLAAHYGYAGIDGDELRRVRVQDEARRGLLGHGSVLVVTSNPTRTSVVKRGKWILDNLLADPPPPPPPGTAFPEAAEVDAAADLRRQMTLHRQRADCAQCHARMDGLGFALESFDAVGRRRQAPVDDRGELPGGRVVLGVGELRALLRDDPSFPRALAARLFVYAVGRPPADTDRVQIEALVLQLERAGPITLPDLVQGIVRLPAFCRRARSI